MRYILTAILFPFVSSITIASQVMHNDFFHNWGQHVTKNADVSAMSSKLTKDTYFTIQEFETETDIAVIKLPLGIKISNDLFKKHDNEDVPYVLESEATRLFNKQGDKKNSALYTIASLWAANEDGNFISDLDFVHPGIVEKIKKIQSFEDLKSTIKILEN